MTDYILSLRNKWNGDDPISITEKTATYFLLSRKSLNEKEDAVCRSMLALTFEEETIGEKLVTHDSYFSDAERRLLGTLLGLVQDYSFTVGDEKAINIIEYAGARCQEDFVTLVDAGIYEPSGTLLHLFGSVHTSCWIRSDVTFDPINSLIHVECPVEWLEALKEAARNHPALCVRGK